MFKFRIMSILRHYPFMSWELKKGLLLFTTVILPLGMML